jgi:integrase
MPEVKVKVRASNGRLQLVFSDDGKRRYLSLSLSDTPKHRTMAAMKASEIEQDFLYDRYKGFAHYQGRVTPITPKGDITLDDLWRDFVEYKRGQVSETTIAVDYAGYTAALARCPHGFKDAVKIRNWAIGACTYESARRFIGALSACCEWAVKSGVIEVNPFADLKLERNRKKSKAEINPFTAEERDRIIAAFDDHEYYRHYAPIVRFLFSTGCRPSEAIALEWRHIKGDHIMFEQAATKGVNGVRVKQGLKTEARRRIRINAGIKTLLDGIKRVNDRVFQAPRGGLIQWGNFQKNGWTACLKDAGVEYRKPYQMRHTFITLALESGMDAKDVAKMVGNSAEIIYRHYAGSLRDLEVPEL